MTVSHRVIGRTAAVSAAALLVLTTLTAGPASASSGYQAAEPAARASGCRVPSDDGNTRRLFSSLTKRYDVKQIDQDENFSGAAKELTFVLERSKTVSNSVQKSGEVSGGMKVGAFGSLEAKAGVNLGDSNTKYTFEQTTENLVLKTGDIYFRARGVRVYRLTTTFQTCFRRPQRMVWVTTGKATARGHLKVKAVVGCKQKTPAGSFARQIKGYCP